MEPEVRSRPFPSSDSSQTVPFADTVTIARVVGALEARKKQVLIRRGNSSSFSDLREGAVVLIGAFNNEWSLRSHAPAALQPGHGSGPASYLYSRRKELRFAQLELGAPISLRSR